MASAAVAAASPSQTPSAASASMMVLASEADIILPPPSAVNPLPSLSAALRLDNREQLITLLLNNATAAATAATTSSTSTSRQLLVFEDDALRTLLLRQVLNDPHTSTSNSSSSSSSSGQNNINKSTKKNWDTYNVYTYPHKILQSSIVGTKILYKRPGRSVLSAAAAAAASSSSMNTASGSSTSGTAASSTNIFSNVQGGGMEVSMNMNVNPFDDTSSSSGGDEDLLGETLPAGQHIDVVTYFLRPFSPQATQLLASRRGLFSSSSSSSSSKGNRHHYSNNTTRHVLVYLPQPTALIHQVLHDSGLLATVAATASNNIQVESLQLDLFPLESDVLSMELPNALQDAIVEGTPSNLIHTCARTLLKLQDVVCSDGTMIPRCQSLGPLAEEVLSKASNMAVDEYLQQGSVVVGGGGGSSNNTTNSNYFPPKKIPSNHLALIVLDRQVDMVTPLITPLTYEGLLDEVVGIEGGFLQVPLSMLNPEGAAGEETTTTQGGQSPSPLKKDKTTTNNKTKQQQRVALGVHAGDSLYAEVRDQHVEKFGSFLQNQAKALQESHAHFTNKGTKKDLSEIHQFVKQIPVFTQNLRSLTNHIHLAEQIKAHTEQVAFREQWQTERSILEGETCYDILEEWICSNHPISKVLRALCLQSLCGGGLKASRYDALRNLIVQGYGYEYLLKLYDLERLGWIRRRDTLWMDSASSAFVNLRKSLILIHAEVDTVEPDDIAYVSSGYAPLSVRLVQAAVQGWTKSRAELLKDLPGRLVDIETTWPPQDLNTILLQQQQGGGAPTQSLGDYAKRAAAAAAANGNGTTTGGGAAVAAAGRYKYKPTLLVFFVGGISYSEIAALRFLSKRPSFPFHIVMVTTKIVNGNVMLQQTL